MYEGVPVRLSSGFNPVEVSRWYKDVRVSIDLWIEISPGRPAGSLTKITLRAHTVINDDEPEEASVAIGIGNFTIAQLRKDQDDDFNKLVVRPILRDLSDPLSRGVTTSDKKWCSFEVRKPASADVFVDAMFKTKK